MLRLLGSQQVPSSAEAPAVHVVLPTGDFTEFDMLFAPTDDIHGALVTELEHATGDFPSGSVECHSSQYGFTDADVADLFVALSPNASSRFLFDKSQAQGHAEAPIIADLKQRIPAPQMAVGTSDVAHQILHTKAVALLYPDATGWVLTGSYNLSHTAGEQFNIVTLIRSRSAAELVAQRIDEMFDWVMANEPQ